MLHLTENWYIDANDNSYMLIEWDGKWDSRGDPTNIRRRYYSTLQSLVANGIMKHLPKKFLASKIELVELLKWYDELLYDPTQIIYAIAKTVIKLNSSNNLAELINQCEDMLDDQKQMANIINNIARKSTGRQQEDCVKA